jgi:hypothetical protein
VYRIYPDKYHVLFLVNNNIRPFGKTVREPEEPILLGDHPVWPEITEQGCSGYAEIFRPRFFTRYGIYTDANGNGIKQSEDIQVIFKGFHLGSSKRCPCQGMEGKERSFAHIFKKIEGLVVLVFQRKIPCRISRLNYLLRPHEFHHHSYPLVYRISGFVSEPAQVVRKTYNHDSWNPAFR